MTVGRLGHNNCACIRINENIRLKAIGLRRHRAMACQLECICNLLT